MTRVIVNSECEWHLRGIPPLDLYSKACCCVSEYLPIKVEVALSALTPCLILTSVLNPAFSPPLCLYIDMTVMLAIGLWSTLWPAWVCSLTGPTQTLPQLSLLKLGELLVGSASLSLLESSIRCAQHNAGVSVSLQLTRACSFEVKRAMRQRAISVSLRPQIEQRCIQDLSVFCSVNTERGKVSM